MSDGGCIYSPATSGYSAHRSDNQCKSEFFLSCVLSSTLTGLGGVGGRGRRPLLPCQPHPHPFLGVHHGGANKARAYCPRLEDSL